MIKKCCELCEVFVENLILFKKFQIKKDRKFEKMVKKKGEAKKPLPYLYFKEKN